MPVESAADRASFLAEEDFASVGTYRARAGAVAEPVGILNDPHLSVIVADGAPVSDSQPTFICASADLPTTSAGGDAGDTLTIGDTRYSVADLQPDGTGMTLVILARM